MVSDEREENNKAGCNKRSAAAAKCQDVSLDDFGTETGHTSEARLLFFSLVSKITPNSPKRVKNNIKRVKM